MTQSASELHGRLAATEELEQAIAAGKYESLSDLRLALQKRAEDMQADLRAWVALNTILTPTVSWDGAVTAIPSIVLH